MTAPSKTRRFHSLGRAVGWWQDRTLEGDRPLPDSRGSVYHGEGPWASLAFATQFARGKGVR